MIYLLFAHQHEKSTKVHANTNVYACAHMRAHTHAMLCYKNEATPLNVQKCPQSRLERTLLLLSLSSTRRLYIFVLVDGFHQIYSFVLFG